MSQINSNQVTQPGGVTSAQPHQGVVEKIVYKVAGVDRAERIVNAAGRSLGKSDCEGRNPSHSHETLKDSVINAIPGPKFVKKYAFGESDAERAEKLDHPM